MERMRLREKSPRKRGLKSTLRRRGSILKINGKGKKREKKMRGNLRLKKGKRLRTISTNPLGSLTLKT